MDEEPEDVLGSINSLGLSTILQSAGVDTEAFSSFLQKTGGGSSRDRDLAEIEAQDEEKYEDDVSDSELQAESAEELAAKRRRDEAAKAEERYYRLALAQQVKEARQKAAEVPKLDKAEMEWMELKRVWPEFEKGRRLKMTEVFYETPAMRRGHEAAVARKKRRKLDQHEEIKVTRSLPPPPPTSIFLQPTLAPIVSHSPLEPRYNTPIGRYFDKDWVREAKQRKWKEVTQLPANLDLETSEVARPLDLVNWEKDIIMCSLPIDPTPKDPLLPRNAHIETDDWLQNIIWDSRKVTADIVEADEDDMAGVEGVLSRPLTEGMSEAQLAAQAKLDPFNISNDHLYEHTREAKFRIRQTFGTIEVVHSGPAKKLQMPWYKTSLSKSEARAWHRPSLQFPTGISLQFSKLKSNPSISSSKKKVLADPGERFKTSKDLTLTEKGSFVLLEFSEEYPPIMSGYGMGTTVVNYYRKKDDKDEFVPKLDFGQPSILNVGDAEPFLLGYVDPGNVTQVIHNNLIRAPIFRHTPETSDFLVIRQTINGHPTYHIREIKNLFTVGQTVPNESEVPGPHARKNTNTAKMRLMQVAWQLVNKSKKKRIELKSLVRYFPDQTELQMRQRLKIKGNEFLMYVRDHPDEPRYWKINPDYEFPKSRKEVEEVVPPEWAVLYEAMQVGARHLHDAGYSKTAEGNAEDEMAEGADTGLDIEQQLAVWSTTLNYKKAEAQKAWLLLHGEGDPTGRGEGFSFLKTNMKGYFLRKGETDQGRRLEAEAKANGNQVKISNAAQQQIYEEEKRRVWDLQNTALSSTVPPKLEIEDETPAPTASTPRFRGSSSSNFKRGHSRAGSMAAGGGGGGTPGYMDSPRDRDDSPAFSGDGDEESTFTGHDRNAGKILRIRRIVNGETVVEVYRDPAVIASYLRRLEEKKLDYYAQHPELLAPTGNAEEDAVKAAALRMELEKIRKNQQRRLARKKYYGGGLDDGEVAIKEGGKRKCGACGALGHTKTNRSCPKYNATSIGPSPGASGSTPGYGRYDPMDMGMGMYDQNPSGSSAGGAAGGGGGGMKIKLSLGGGR